MSGLLGHTVWFRSPFMPTPVPPVAWSVFAKLHGTFHEHLSSLVFSSNRILVRLGIKKKCHKLTGFSPTCSLWAVWELLAKLIKVTYLGFLCWLSLHNNDENGVGLAQLRGGCFLPSLPCILAMPYAACCTMGPLHMLSSCLDIISFFSLSSVLTWYYC